MGAIEVEMLHPGIERLDRDAILAIQRDKLARLGKRLAGSLEWSAHFRAAGLNPRDLADPQGLGSMPTLSASDLRARYPFPMLTAQPHQVERFFTAPDASCPQVMVGFTARDHAETLARQVARALRCAGVRSGDRAYQGFGFGLQIEGAAFEAGLRALGATVFPVGPGRGELAAQWMRDQEWTIAVAPAGVLADMVRVAQEQGIAPDRDWRLRLALSPAADGGPTHEDFGLALPGGFAAHRFYGRPEAGGPVIAVSCPHSLAAGELHLINEDSIVTEILDPETGAPVGPGMTGEIVLTTLDKEASPIVRFRTGDRARLSDRPFDCPCGRIGLRRVGLLRVGFASSTARCVIGRGDSPGQYELRAKPTREEVK